MSYSEFRQHIWIKVDLLYFSYMFVCSTSGWNIDNLFRCNENNYFVPFGACVRKMTPPSFMFKLALSPVKLFWCVRYICGLKQASQQHTAVCDLRVLCHIYFAGTKRSFSNSTDERGCIIDHFCIWAVSETETIFIYYFVIFQSIWNWNDGNIVIDCKLSCVYRDWLLENVIYRQIDSFLIVWYLFKVYSLQSAIITN